MNRTASQIPDNHFVNGNPLRGPFPEGMQLAAFGMGCFWGAERRFWETPGVYVTAVGYAGGHTEHPSYQDVCGGDTGHAEIVLVVFDPATVSYADLLRLFLKTMTRPRACARATTSVAQYRSSIQVFDDGQRSAANTALAGYQARLREAGLGAITTEIVDAGRLLLCGRLSPAVSRQKSARLLRSGRHRRELCLNCPDIDVYVDAIAQTAGAHPLDQIRIGNPFLLRSIATPPEKFTGRPPRRGAPHRQARSAWLRRRPVGRRASHDRGPLSMEAESTAADKQTEPASFDFDHGSLLLTEAGTKKRASLYLVSGEDSLGEHDPGGLEPLRCNRDAFSAALTQSNHTLKRALTDPRIFSGIGNAYSDEILHAARLSPVRQTQRLSDNEISRLFEATTQTLSEWRERLLREAGGTIPSRVTAFRPDMAVHGRYGKPCPTCGEPVQRIRYKSNETNYCARCQNEGRLLKDRSLSRLLKQDWPKTLDDL